MGIPIMEFSHFTFLLFTAFSGLRLFSYLPQIRKVARDENGATAISYLTWAVWTGANIATALYAATNLKDIYLTTVSAMYAGCCVIVISLTIRKRLGSQATRHVPAPTADERALLMEAAQALVRRQGAALAAGARPGPDFELHLLRHCRSIVFHDLTEAIASWIERCRRDRRAPRAQLGPAHKPLMRRIGSKYHAAAALRTTQRAF
jgi:hypothetical protein